MTGQVFDIQRCSIGDGPGIRTSVFLKGCPLRCQWCHNPESWQMQPQWRRHVAKCVHCGACEKRRMDAEICAYGALECCGREMDAETVLEMVLRDKVFFDASGGGMTITGGEPLMQPAFTLALCKKGKEAGLHICIETSGYGDRQSLLSLMPFMDLFLYDFKESDPSLHRRYTGVSNEKILENLDTLCQEKARIILRCPIIPGFNERPEHFRAIGQLAQMREQIEAIHVEPYHPLGTEKRSSFSLPPQPAITIPKEQQIEAWLDAIRRYTDKPVSLP